MANKLRTELLNPKKYMIPTELETNLSYYQIINDVYDMAYELLCQTIGEDNIVSYRCNCNGDKEHYPDGIDIEKVAENMGIFVENNSTAGFYNAKSNDLSTQKDLELNVSAREAMKNSGEISKSYIELYNENELNCVSQSSVRKDFWQSNDYVAKIVLASFLSVPEIRYEIALNIAKIYFTQLDGLATFTGVNRYNMGLFMIDTPKEFIEKIFAYALLAPDKLMLEGIKKYREDSMKWPFDFSDWVQTNRAMIGIPEYTTVYMLEYWKALQTYKHIQNLIFSNKHEEDYRTQFLNNIGKVSANALIRDGENGKVKSKTPNN